MRTLKVFSVLAIVVSLSISCQKEGSIELNTLDVANAKGGGSGGEMQLVYSISQTFLAQWNFEVPTERKKKYLIRIKGLYSDGGGANNLDAAYDLRGNIPYNQCSGYAASRWRFLNKCDIRPNIDVVSSSHIYDYSYTSDGTPFKFDFSDECCYWDNSGQLDFEIYKVRK